MTDSPAVQPPHPQTIVVGIDGSEPSHVAFDWALELADALGADLRVVTAWEVPYHWAEGYNVMWYDDREELGASARESAKVTVTDWLGDRKHPAHVTVEAVEGPPALALLDAAAGADLLVVGARGRGGFKSLLLGSVSTACVHHAPCPVVVVPRPEETGSDGAAQDEDEGEGE